MTDFQFKTDLIKEYEVTSEFSTEDYEKKRVKTPDITIDLAFLSLENRDKADYIEGRKKELRNQNTEVPHPYKPETNENEKEDNLVSFDSNSIGKGYADPEFNIVEKSEDKIVRYQYMVGWKDFENNIAEVEIFTMKDSDFGKKDFKNILENLEIIE